MLLLTLKSDSHLVLLVYGYLRKFPNCIHITSINSANHAKFRVNYNVIRPPQDVKMLLSIPMGSAWMELHPNFLQAVPAAKDLSAGIPPNTIKQQNHISQNWLATNWTGGCDELTKVSNPTLIITGTYDNNVPTANSLIIAGKIPGAWLVQIKDAGHALFVQYPDKVNRVLQTFLSTTINPG